MATYGARLGQLVKKSRKLQFLTVEQLARKTGLSAAVIRNLENGKTANPRKRTEHLLTRGLNVDLARLMSPTDQTTASFQPALPKDPLVNIAANADHELELQTSFNDEDDVDTIETYRSQFIDILKNEIARYGSNRNRPQADVFLPKHQSLLSELSKPKKEINFVSVHLTISRLIIARTRAEEAIKATNSDWPHFDVDEREAIDTLCTLSGPLVMASSVGRRVVADTSIYNLHEKDERTADKLLSTVIQDFSDAQVSSQDTQKFLEQINEITEDEDPHPSRTRRVKFALVGSLLVVSAGASVLATLTLGTAGLAGAGTANVLGYIWAKKVIESDPDFKELVYAGNNTLQKTSRDLSEKSTALVNKLDGVFRNNLQQIGQLSKLVTEFRWVAEYVTRASEQVELTSGVSNSVCYFLFPKEQRLMQKLERAFRTLEVQHGQFNSHVLDVSTKKQLQKAVRLSRMGDSLILVLEEGHKDVEVTAEFVELLKSETGVLKFILFVGDYSKEPWLGFIKGRGSLPFPSTLLALFGSEEVDLLELGPNDKLIN